MYCVFCGTENPEFASFCEKCGKPVNWKQNQLSPESEASSASNDIDRPCTSPSEPIPPGALHEPSDSLSDSKVREFQKTYSEMSNEEILRLAGDLSSLTECALHALKSELQKRGLEEPSIEDDKRGSDLQQDTLKKGGTGPMKLSGWLIPTWFIALLVYNVWAHWSQNVDKGSLYILWEAIGQLTTPIELLLSAAVVYGILSRGRASTRNGEVQNLRRRFISHPAFRTVYILVGTTGLLVLALFAIASLQRLGTKQPDNQASQSSSQVDKSTVNPHALDSYEVMSKAKADFGTADDGLTPEAKKRMRETFALELSGAMQKQNNPIHVEVLGDNHDVLELQAPSMNDEISGEFIHESGGVDANFWNGMRLMNFSQLVFSGDGYKKVITREDIIGYSKDYEKYKADFLRVTKGLQAGAQGELKKP